MTPIAAVIMWGASFATIHNCPQADICVTVYNRLSASPDHYEGELSRPSVKLIARIAREALK